MRDYRELLKDIREGKMSEATVSKSTFKSGNNVKTSVEGLIEEYIKELKARIKETEQRKKKIDKEWKKSQRSDKEMMVFIDTWSVYQRIYANYISELE